jgi:antitoxin component YwqK of YwqJK toxin-antitoxin module
MKFFIVIVVFSLFCSCNNTKIETKKNKIIEKQYILNSSSNVRINQDTLFYKNKKFSGCVYDFYSNTNDSVFVAEYINGINDGILKRFYPDKKLMEIRTYFEGKKNGKQVSYWQNGNKRFEFIAKNDVYEGELKEWNIENKLIHLAHFKNGQEEGIQKLWYDNGKIRANYVIRNGRRYGLLGTKNCKNVSDTIFNNG